MMVVGDNMIKNLKNLRNQRGISQQALAEVIGVSQQSINKYENHNIEPDIDTLIRIADYFETTVDYLIGHAEAERISPYDLSTAEMKLIDNYRMLSKKHRDLLSTIAGELVE